MARGHLVLIDYVGRSSLGNRFANRHIEQINIAGFLESMDRHLVLLIESVPNLSVAVRDENLNASVVNRRKDGFDVVRDTRRRLQFAIAIQLPFQAGTKCRRKDLDSTSIQFVIG